MLAHDDNGTIREREARQCHAVCCALFVLFSSGFPALAINMAMWDDDLIRSSGEFA
jgi:hypothetical protein